MSCCLGRRTEVLLLSSWCRYRGNCNGLNRTGRQGLDPRSSRKQVNLEVSIQN